LFTSVKENLLWWLWVWVTFASIIAGAHFGVLAHIWMVDRSCLSLSILGIYLLSTGFIGYTLHRNKDSYNAEPFWFISDTMQTVGQIGTVIGLIMMFGLFSNNLDIGQSDTLKKLISGMAEAGGTALWVTLSSLICSVYLKTQLMILGDRNAK
jgi:hypothetical protein